MLNDLDRARDILARFRFPDEEGAVSLLQAQILHDEGRYDEAIEKIEVMMRNGTTTGGEADEDERTLQRSWTVWSLRAKPY